MKKLSLLIAFLLFNIVAFGQAAGFIEGKVTDSEGKPLPNASVTVKQGGQIKGSEKTDKFGTYNIKPLASGTYEVIFTYSGLASETIPDIQVAAGSGATVNSKLLPKVNTVGGPGGLVIKGKRRVFIDATKPGGAPAQSGTQIAKMATTSVLDAATNRPGVYQKKAGSGISLGGGRESNTMYMIDGILVRDVTRVIINPQTVENLSVSIGGLPANLGDATGGVIQITTKGMSAKPTGSINFQHSIDGYNNNQLNVNLRGPLYKKKEADGSVRPVLGYALAFGGIYNTDNDPTYYKNYIPTAQALARIKAEPLKASSTPSGETVFRNTAEYLTANDFTTSKARANAGNQALTYNLKLVYRPTTSIDVTLGANGSYTSNTGTGAITYKDGGAGQNTFSNNMFASQNNINNTQFTGRGYLRFQQKLSKSVTNADGSKPLISNAYYVAQLNYEKNTRVRQNAIHKSNFFRYGYVGKFDIYERNQYTYDSTRGGFKGIKFVSLTPDSVKFTADDRYNTDLNAYTKYVYANVATPPQQLGNVAALGGIINGGAPQSVFSIFQNYGANPSTYRKNELDQYSLNFDASFDVNVNEKKANLLNRGELRAKHSIEFGMYYEQRNSRTYGVSTSGMWNQMRQLVNRSIENWDYNNPIWTKNGVKYTLADVQAGKVVVSDLDTINFNRLVVDSATSVFSTNFRKSLGLAANGQEYLNIDSYDPDKFSIDMFGADDLTSQGQQIVAYSGYDHKGNKTSARPSFQDYWTKQNADGSYVRPIAPFNPIYVAGYIQDNFVFREIRVRAGVRIDRYDANQKVLRDPYSLFATRKVTDLKANQFSLVTDAKNGRAPDPTTADFKSQFGNAVVYVNDNAAANGAPKIVGYRIGDSWYDPFGKEVADPSILKQKYAGGSQIQPYLQNGKDLKTLQTKNYDVSAAFTDYKPSILVSPRISFSFPVDGDKSLFYAHYDLVTQRPTEFESFITPDDYYYINDRAGQNTLANPNLAPEKNVDYELGFQQQLNTSSALTISGFYKERRDQIQLQNIVNAYPVQYETYGNRDFSTTKGMTLLYDLRPQSGLLSLNVAYTLQFAEGTGSGPTSQRSLLASGQPNLRTVLPLDFDSRHNFTANLDYRFNNKEGENGPHLGKYHPFANAGLNLVMQARSGEPFTKLTRAVPIVNGDFNSNIISGTVNGSRRPWSFNVNLRVDKNITLNRFNKKDADGKQTIRKSFDINLYAYTQNLLNTRNIIAVHPFTGLSDDDGFLNSAQGQQTINLVASSKESFLNYYRMAMRNPAYFSNPRTIFVGFTFSF
jgi:Carboxypeptidase regulatory-like domain/TonB dependent receptor